MGDIEVDTDLVGALAGALLDGARLPLGAAALVALGLGDVLDDGAG